MPGEGSQLTTAFYRRVLDGLPAALFAVDRAWRIIFANPRANQLLQAADGGAAGRRFDDFPDLAGGEFEAEGRRIMQEQRPARFEVHLPSASRWCEVHAYPGDAELLFFVQDMTAVQAAEARRRMFESVVAHAYDSVLITEAHPLDPPGPRIVYVNEAFTRTTGYEPKDVLGRTPRMFQGPGTDPAAKAKIREALTRHERVQVELLNYKKNGTPFFVEMSIAPVFDARQHLIYLTSVQRDTTSRREAHETAVRLAREEAAHAEANRARRETESILESITDAFVALDREGTIVYANKRAAESMGRSREALLARNIWESFPELIDSSIFAEYKRAQNTQAPAQCEFYHAPANAWLDIHFYPTADGMTCYIRDVTERKRAEEVRQFLVEVSNALAGSLQHEDIMDNVLELAVPTCADFCIVDLVEEDGRLVTVQGKHDDPARMALLAALRDHPPSRAGAGERATPAKEAELIAEVSEEALEKLSADDDHLRVLRQLAPRSLMIVPMRARDRPVGTLLLAAGESRRRYDERDLAMAEDLANRSAMAIDNARLYQDVVHAIRTRDEMMHIVAHDLKTPLMLISWNVDVLSGMLGEGDGQHLDQRPLEKIRRSVERASRLIADLLDVSAMRAGRLDVKRARADALPLVEEAVDTYMPAATEKQIELKADVPRALERVELDPDRILQVLVNLIDNAIKFTPKAGEVTVEVEQTRDDVQFAVHDTGYGIPEEQRPHVFDPFWRAERGSGGGTGLGLAIAKGIIEAHDGRMWVESEPGQGSTFVFALPRA